MIRRDRETLILKYRMSSCTFKHNAIYTSYFLNKDSRQTDN